MAERGTRSLKRNSARTLFWVLWGGLLLTKLWLAAVLPLFGDEAFYWLESRHPAPAQDDVPGMTPWLIAFGGWLFGDGRLGVRLPFVLLGAFTAWWLTRIVAARFGAAAGWQAGLLALLLPLFALNGLLALPDVPLTLAVLVCVAALQRLAIDSRPGGWRWRAHGLLGLGLALGWLSHYRFLVLFAAAGLWLLVDPVGRRLLRQPATWLAGIAGCAIGLAPLAVQQIRSGGAGVAFQFAERHPWRLQAEGLADPLLQAVATTPGLFVVLLAALWAGWRRRDDPAIATLCGVASMMLALFMLLAPFVDTERSRLHWPLPGWMLLAMLAPLAWASWSRPARLAASMAVAFAALVVLAVVLLLGLMAVAPGRLAATPMYLHNLAGWPAIATRVDADLRRLPPDTVLAADNFMLAAELSFELGGRPVYSLDHPLNAKHGRQGELTRMGLDEAALTMEAARHPVLLVAEEGASSLLDRPRWFRRLCDAWPAAMPRFELSVDHGRKRHIAWLHRPGGAGGCLPPALAYLHEPIFGARVDGRLQVSGWAIRDRAGIDRLWLSADGRRVAEIDHGLSSPGVQASFPGSDDPRHPDVGFVLSLQPDWPAGRYWIAIEADGADGPAVLASVPIDWTPSRPATEP